MNIVCIVQARMDSSRFPGKVLADLAGRPILEHVVTRAQASGLPVVVATTDRKVDDPIAAWAVVAGVKTFRWGGGVEDVLGRFHACAEHHGADAIVRVTADSPFVPPDVLTLVAASLIKGRDVAVLTSGFGLVPDGWEAEGCLTDVLRHLDGDHPTIYEREHVFPGVYIRLARRGNVLPVESSANEWNAPWLMKQKFSVDAPEDLEWLRFIAQHLDCTPPRPSAEDLVTLLSEHPELQRPLVQRTT